MLKFSICGRNKESEKDIKLINNDERLKEDIVHTMPTLISDSIYSDNYEVCQIVKDLCQHFDYKIENEYIEIAEKRGIKKIIETCKDDGSLDETLKTKIITDVLKHTGRRSHDSPLVFDLIPKCVEFPLHDELAKIKNMLPDTMENNETILITYKDLIHNMWVPTVHYQENECPEDCSQKN